MDGPPPAGLSAAEAARRLAADGPNLLPGSAPKSGWALAREVLTEPMFLMLLAAGGIYLALGDRAEALFLLGFVFTVIATTLAQQRKTQRALESLRELSAPRALVQRDGQTQRVPGREVVRGDLLVLREGDRIAADARLCEGQLEVDESLLTGEAVPVAKRPAAEGQGGRVFASTVVTRGTGLAVVEAVGQASAVGRIGADLAATAEPPSGLQQASRRLVRGLGLVAALLASLQVGLLWVWDDQPLLDSLLSGLALAMAVLPQEIPVILTVFLAMGAWRIARQQVLTRRVSAVEALGAITVLAVDKTGTLTVNRMVLTALAGADARFDAREATPLPAALQGLVEAALLATPVDPFDPMEKAIQLFGRERLGEAGAALAAAVPAQAYPLSPTLLAMTQAHRAADGGHRLATKGAPEAVAELCRLPPERLQQVRAQVEAMAAQGLRVLGVAGGHCIGPLPARQQDLALDFLGLLGLVDPPRPEVPAALAECRRAGVRVVMMTGDHPATARAIARQVGLSERPEVLTGAELTALDDTALARRLQQVDLCARLQPAHKLRLVRVLQASGQVVAMTGDGVNDAPALKAADIGIAMGQRGTDVAREAAALVLLDDSFSRIVATMRQGRHIYDNIGKATRFTFAVHMPIVVLALVPVLLGWPPLLWPVHIVLMELLIDPSCSIVFEAEPQDPGLMDRPPRPPQATPFAPRVLAGAVVQGLGLAALLLGGYAGALAQGADAAQGRGLVFASLVLMVLLLILANRNPARALWRSLAVPNRWVARMAAAVGLMLVLVFGLPWLRQLMGVAPLAWGHWALVAGLVAVGTLWLELWRRLGPDEAR